MGTKCAPTYANIFVCVLQSLALGQITRKVRNKSLWIKRQVQTKTFLCADIKRINEGKVLLDV